MSERRYETLMSSVMDIGKTMLVSGAEIYRVEDSLIRLMRSYGASSWQVNAVPSHIVASATFDGREYTLVRRVETTETDLELLSRLNDLCRRLCRETPPPEEIGALLGKAEAGKKYNDVQMSLIYALTASMFTFFFTGTWIDAIISAVIASSLYWVRKVIIKYGANRVFVALFCSAYAALLAKLLIHVGFGADADKIIVGVVMVLIPGVEMVNGFRDFSVGDIQAGLMHISEALFLAVMIAVGAAGMFMLAQTIGL